MEQTRYNRFDNIRFILIVCVEGDLGEYYGVAKYFEAASYYKIYQESGDTVRANYQKEKMDAALEEMGDLSAEAERIKEKLDISE